MIEADPQRREYMVAVAAVAQSYGGRGHTIAAMIARRVHACRDWSQYQIMVEPLIEEYREALPTSLLALMLDPPGE